MEGHLFTHGSTKTHSPCRTDLVQISTFYATNRASSLLCYRLGDAKIFDSLKMPSIFEAVALCCKPII